MPHMKKKTPSFVPEFTKSSLIQNISSSLAFIIAAFAYGVLGIVSVHGNLFLFVTP